MKTKKFDKRVWLFIVAFTFIIPGYYFIKAKVYNVELDSQFGIVTFIFTFLVTLTITYVNMVFIGRYFDKILPWSIDSRKITVRLVLETLTTSLSAAIIISVIVYPLNIYFGSLDGSNSAQLYFDNITVAIIVNLIALSIVEGNSIYVMFRETLFQAEKLQRENVETQFAVLKNQVNPHFLFNSLNVLSSLISQSPAAATEFVQEFAKIYRYIFDVGDKTVLTVKSELDFIQSYVSLQKKRHGQGLQLTVKIDSEFLEWFIPVLSLQILVENAIKHNEVSSSKPLQIDIYNEKQLLFVRNNYQPRKDLPESHGIGLKNLKNRYSYLSVQKPSFYIENGYYFACLPLIADE